jgi:hypothetical protein
MRNNRKELLRHVRSVVHRVDKKGRSLASERR